MQQLIFKPWRSLRPRCQKNDTFTFHLNCKYFLKIVDIKILKNIPLYLEAKQ